MGCGISGENFYRLVRSVLLGETQEGVDDYEAYNYYAVCRLTQEKSKNGGDYKDVDKWRGELADQNVVPVNFFCFDFIQTIFFESCPGFFVGKSV